MSATIKSARRAEGDKATWTNDQGTTFNRWLVTVQNGSEEISTDILRKPESPDPTGLPVEQKNGRWKVAQQQNSGGRGGGKFEADPKKLRGENYRSALHAAVSLVEATNNTNVSSDEVVALANKFYDAIEAKARVDWTS